MIGCFTEKKSTQPHVVRHVLADINQQIYVIEGVLLFTKIKRFRVHRQFYHQNSEILYQMTDESVPRTSRDLHGNLEKIKITCYFCQFLTLIHIAPATFYPARMFLLTALSA